MNRLFDAIGRHDRVTNVRGPAAGFWEKTIMSMIDVSVQDCAPVEKPTPEMIEAGVSVIEQWCGVVDSAFLAGEVYSAMARLAIPSSPAPAKPDHSALAGDESSCR